MMLGEISMMSRKNRLPRSISTPQQAQYECACTAATISGLPRACIVSAMLFGRCWLIAAVSGWLLFMSLATFGQDLGHKVPGLLGLDAGTIPEPGLYLV